MNKYEFIKNLQDALKGHVSNADFENQISYYENYINDEVNKGKSESEVISELGDPKLIAKTIIDVNGNDNDDNNSYVNSNSDSTNDNNSYNSNRRYNSFNLGCGLSSIILLIIILSILQFMGILLRGTFYMFGGSGIFIIILIFIIYNIYKNKGV